MNSSIKNDSLISNGVYVGGVCVLTCGQTRNDNPVIIHGNPTRLSRWHVGRGTLWRETYFFDLSLRTTWNNLPYFKQYLTEIFGNVWTKLCRKSEIVTDHCCCYCYWTPSNNFAFFKVLTKNKRICRPHTWTKRFKNIFCIYVTGRFSTKQQIPHYLKNCKCENSLKQSNNTKICLNF